MIENIITPHPALRLFPEREKVFVEQDSWLCKHMHPLCSIDLSAVIAGETRWIPLLSPIEPHDCYIGSYTAAFHNDWCGENWIAFRLDTNDRFQFLGQREYFVLESVAPPNAREWVRDALLEDYVREEQSFIDTQKRFSLHGGLYHPKRFKPLEKSDPEAEASALIEQLGGAVGFANWTDFPPPPAAFHLDASDRDDIKLYTRDGERLHFIAGVPGWHYRKSGADWILLFYAPRSRIALMTFDWT
jgi:hypothetical protein